MSELTPANEAEEVPAAAPVWRDDVVTDLLGELEAGVAEWLNDQATRSDIWARAMLRGVLLAGTAGYRVDGVVGERALRLVDASGAPLVLSALAVRTPQDFAGPPAALQALRSSLDIVFAGRKYALFVRKPLPVQFVAAPVARAVQLWLSAIDRGDWQGRHAIYEDDAVAIEITLVTDQGASGAPRLLEVGPVDALERLASVDHGLMALLAGLRDEVPDTPLAIVLDATPAWRAPRGYVEQLLYGTADWISTASSDGDLAYRAGFRANGRSLFSDSLCDRLTSLWWTEDFEVDRDGFLCWTTENPWCSDVPADVQAARFARTPDPVDVRGATTMSWTAPRPSVWVPRGPARNARKARPA